MEGGNEAMSKTVDERVVQMEFDNKNFESNVKTSMNTLDRLKQALQFKGASKGLEDVNSAAKKVDLSAIGQGADEVQLKFSALQVAAATVFSRITSAAMDAGRNLVSAFTIEPILDGFREYETQINAVQTILANTQSKGTTIDQVNSALDELNEYADKTIYNFAEMTKNIGTFTAAGVDLDKAVSAIKGIANLGAMSGSTSMQVSGAMYQLSQALAAGRVSLMDWNSVVNAGMGGEQFQNALKRTAENFGYDVDGMIEKYGSFRESLTQGGWLTAEVLTETLNQIAGAYTEADLIAQGYTEDQARAIVEMAQTAEDAATKVKTFTQLMSTLKEAAGSGWAQSFEIIFGDFEEAKGLFTELNDMFSEVIGNSAESRNAMLQGWADMGGRTNLIKGVMDALHSIGDVISAVKEGFQEVIPPMTSSRLYELTMNFYDLMQQLKPSAENLERIKRIAKGVASGIDIIGKAISAVVKPIGELIFSDGVGGFVDMLLEIVATVGDVITAINEGLDAGDIFGSLSEGLGKGLGVIGDILGRLTSGMDSFKDILTTVGGVVGDIFGGIIDTIGGALDWIVENVSIGDIFNGIMAAFTVAGFKQMGGFFDNIKEALGTFIGEESILTKAPEMFDALHDSIESFTTGIQVGSLVGIATAITLLSVALGNLAELDVPQIGTSLAAMAGLIAMLNGSFALMVKTLSKYDAKGTLRSSIALIAMAAAIKIFADAMIKVSDLDMDQIGKGLLALGVGLAEMVGALTLLNKFSGGASSIAGAIGILIAVQALSDISDALRDIGSLNWETIAKGLAGMGVALLEISGLTAALGKISGISSIFAGGAILIVAQSLKPIGDALSSIGGLSWEEIAKGLVGMGLALAELAGMTAVLDRISGISSIFASGAILIVAQALEPIGDALSNIGKLSWEEIARGLVGMGVALAELGTVSGLVGKLAGFSGLLGAGTILLSVQSLTPIADALSEIGKLSWEEIGRGLVGMGGALAELGIVSGALGYLTGIAGLAGAGTIALASTALDDIANALKKFGEMSWEEIGQGLAAMGAALGEIALGSLANTLGIIGSMSISTVAEPLGTLADSVKKWVGIEIPENFGGNLTDLARGVEAFTFSGWGSDSIASVAGPLGVLADSVKKWVGVSVPEGLGEQFKSLADAVGAFIWSGFAGDGIGSIAEPLGTLADSVKKWTGITVPENMQANLESLAAGVKAFDWSWGWSLDSFVGPLGDLADSVKKWSGITVPSNLQSMLEGLAAGVKSFDWSWGWSLESFIEPLDQLAGVLPKYSHLAVANDIGTSIESLGNGIKSLAGKNPGDIDGVVSAIDGLADAVTKIGTIDFASAASQITGFTDALSQINVSTESFANIGNDLVNGLVTSIQNGTSRVQAAVTVLVAMIGATFATASVTLNASGLTAGLSIANGIATGISSGTAVVQSAAVLLGLSVQTGISSSIGSFAISGALIASNLAAGIGSGTSMAIAAVQSVTNSCLSVFPTFQGQFRTSGMQLSKILADGIFSGKTFVTLASMSLLSGARSILESYYSTFYSAGQYLVQGLANGMSDNSWIASAAARKVAADAEQAAKDEFGIESPSKVGIEIGKYFDQGLGLGIERNVKLVSAASENAGSTAIDAMRTAMSGISSVMNSDLDYNPTISPVVDLSNVRSGAIRANAMLGNLVSGSTIRDVNVVGRLTDTKVQNGSIERLESKFSELDSRFSELNESMSTLANRPPDELSMYVDGKKLASSIAKPMNRQLGTISRRGALAR